jgi:hypothetical protein
MERRPAKAKVIKRTVYPHFLSKEGRLPASPLA